MRFYEEMERIIKQTGDNALEVLEHYYAIDIKVLQPRRNVHSKAYGNIAGGTAEEIDNIVGIIVGDDFFESDNLFSGSLEAAILFTSATVVKTGQVLQIVSQDGKIRNFRVGKRQGVGLTTEIFNRWELASLAN